MQPDQTKLDELVRRIEEAVHPLRIILFGSAARGEMGPNSDLDVLVVMPDGTHRRNTAMNLYERLWNFGFAKDIVVATPEILEKHCENRWMIYHDALREGKELYRADDQANV
jgi:predicted nucleotidyltransferase